MKDVFIDEIIDKKLKTGDLINIENNFASESVAFL